MTGSVSGADREVDTEMEANFDPNPTLFGSPEKESLGADKPTLVSPSHRGLSSKAISYSTLQQKEPKLKSDDSVIKSPISIIQILSTTSIKSDRKLKKEHMQKLQKSVSPTPSGKFLGSILCPAGALLISADHSISGGPASMRGIGMSFLSAIGYAMYQCYITAFLGEYRVFKYLQINYYNLDLVTVY